MFIIHIEHPYLWLPIDENKEMVTLECFCNNKKIAEMNICLTDEIPEYYSFINVSTWVENEITFSSSKGELSDSFSLRMLQMDDMPPFVWENRPKVHFTPPVGWLNDPNGLVFYKDSYHLFYQWNPYGTEWGNMHWGHAVSKDLFSWKHLPVAICPDEYGTIFSGSAYVDHANAAGFGEDAMLFFYTAAGGSNLWSEKRRFVQKLALSSDCGLTLNKHPGELIPELEESNRDPKVFYHKLSGGYCMILYLSEDRFGIFKSEDLLSWKQTQTIETGEAMWECPDMFELKIEGESESRWIFWTADGFYRIGTFDGYKFEAESETIALYRNNIPYATQTFDNVKDRRLGIAWLRIQNKSRHYRGTMSIPQEYSLTRRTDGLRIRIHPAREWEDQNPEVKEVRLKDDYMDSPIIIEPQCYPVEWHLSWDKTASGYRNVQIADVTIEFNFDKNEIIAKPGLVEANPIRFTISHMDRELMLIQDMEILELYGESGCAFGVMELTF